MGCTGSRPRANEDLNDNDNDRRLLKIGLRFGKGEEKEEGDFHCGYMRTRNRNLRRRGESEESPTQISETQE